MTSSGATMRVGMNSKKRRTRSGQAGENLADQAAAGHAKRNGGSRQQQKKIKLREKRKYLASLSCETDGRWQRDWERSAVIQIYSVLHHNNEPIRSEYLGYCEFSLHETGHSCVRDGREGLISSSLVPSDGYDHTHNLLAHSAAPRLIYSVFPVSTCDERDLFPGQQHRGTIEPSLRPVSLFYRVNTDRHIHPPAAALHPSCCFDFAETERPFFHCFSPAII